MTTHWPIASEPPALADGEAHVWAVPLDGADARWQASWDALSADERGRAEQFRLDDPRRRFVVARAALRTLLGQYLGVPPSDVAIAIALNGKPRLGDLMRPTDIRFNVAHSGDIALITFTSNCEIGVDVERLRPVGFAERIARRFFHAAEAAAITAAPPDARDDVFLRCWTAKEAVVKALGSGITGSLATFRVPTEMHDGAWIELLPARCWLQPLLPAPGYLGAVACVGAPRSIRCFELTM